MKIKEKICSNCEGEGYFDNNGAIVICDVCNGKGKVLNGVLSKNTIIRG